MIVYAGFIYEWTNKLNGKKYIGSHIGKIDDGYTGSGTAFIKAYRKYGSDSFSRAILEYVEDISLIKSIEERYLKSVDAKNNRLYYNLSNTPTGGYQNIDWLPVRQGWQDWATKMLKKPVYQFDLNGNLIKKFDSLTAAALEVGAKSPSNIKYTCDGKFKNAHGYLWSYTSETATSQRPEDTRCKKQVHTPNGVFNTVTAAKEYYEFTSTKMVRTRCLSTADKWKEWYYIMAYERITRKQS
jgi:hypothetical protein